MPPESVWIQYSIIAILILATGAIAGGFYKLWRDQLAWIDKQDAKREEERKGQDAERKEEREKQRTWEAQQTTIRDTQWQAFLKTMQDQWLAQDIRYAAVLTTLVEKTNDLIVAVNNHDTWARAKDRE